jgi:multicomponent Na+:H+ antiporter subunit C
MELLLAVVAGVLYATGLYLMLRRRLAQLIIGLGLLSNGSNVLIFSAAGVTRGKPPLVEEAHVTAASFADPVPQSLILTAVLAFALVLAHRVHESAGSDDVDTIGPDRDVRLNKRAGSEH